MQAWSNTIAPVFTRGQQREAPPRFVIATHTTHPLVPGVAFRHVVQDKQHRKANSGPYHQRHLRDVSPLDILCVFQPVLRIVGNHESNSAETVWRHTGRNPCMQREGGRGVARRKIKSIRAHDMFLFRDNSV